MGRVMGRVTVRVRVMVRVIVRVTVTVMVMVRGRVIVRVRVTVTVMVTVTVRVMGRVIVRVTVMGMVRVTVTVVLKSKHLNSNPLRNLISCISLSNLQPTNQTIIFQNNPVHSVKNRFAVIVNVPLIMTRSPNFFLPNGCRLLNRNVYVNAHRFVIYWYRLIGTPRQMKLQLRFE